MDNWSGAALLPSLFEALRAKPRKHTFVFVAFTGEETGLNGSEFYVKQMTAAQRANIKAMVNLDCLGLSGTKVALSDSDADLAARLNGVAHAMKLPLAAINTGKIGMSDSRPFREKKIPAVEIHSMTQETLPILHSARDQLGVISMDDYCDSYRLVCGYLAYLDSALP